MTTHLDSQPPPRGNSPNTTESTTSTTSTNSPNSPNSIEGAILRRRRVLKKAAWLGVPLILSLHGQAFAKKTNGASYGSGGMSGNTSAPP